MHFIAEAKEAIEDLGYLKGIWEITSSPAKGLWRRFVNSGKIHDYGYFVRYRKISLRYSTRTAGVSIHEIEIEATKDNISHYHGRYIRRPKSKLTVKPPHHEAQMTEIDNQFQKFSIELQEILTKGQTAKIIMELDFEDESHALQPQSVFTPLCQTNSLEFVVIVPNNEKIFGAQGVISHNPGMHMAMSRTKLSINNGILTWKPRHPEILLAYKVIWEWPQNA